MLLCFRYELAKRPFETHPLNLRLLIHGKKRKMPIALDFNVSKSFTPYPSIAFSSRNIPE